MKKQDTWYLLAIIVFACLVISPIYLNGIPVGNDLQQHYQFAVSFSGAWSAGEFYPPGWAAQENNGYGGIGLRFYPPLSYAVLAACKWIAGDWYSGSILAFFFWLAWGGAGVYLWARLRLTAGGALVAALIYMIAPYHIMRLVMSFYAEFAAAAFLPFCFFFAMRLTRGGTKRDIAGLAAAYAALLLTHIPLAVIGSVALAVYALASLRRENWQAGFVRLAAGGLLGLAASSFHWIKVVTEKGWLNHNTAAYFSTGDHYNYRRYFLFFFRYLWDNDPNLPAFLDKAVAVTLALALPLALLFCFRTTREQRSHWRNMLALLVLGFVMATPLSWLLWSKITLLQQIQFPGRWISLISLSLAVFAGAGWEYLPKDRSEQKNRLILLAVAGGALICLSFVLTLMVRKTVYLPKMIVLQMTQKAVNDLNYDCWWPVWVREKTFQTPEKVLIEGRQAEILSWQTYERAFRVSAGAPNRARVALMYYPHWQVRVNNAPVTPAPSSDGALTFELPAEESLVTLSFQEPTAVLWTRKISRVSWLLILLVTIFSLTNSRRKQLLR